MGLVAQALGLLKGARTRRFAVIKIVAVRVGVGPDEPAVAYTTAMPPIPSTRSIRYLPFSVVPTRDWARAKWPIANVEQRDYAAFAIALTPVTRRQR